MHYFIGFMKSVLEIERWHEKIPEWTNVTLRHVFRKIKIEKLYVEVIVLLLKEIMGNYQNKLI